MSAGQKEDSLRIADNPEPATGRSSIATSIFDANADHAQSHDPRWDIALEWNSGQSADTPPDGQGRLLVGPERGCDHPLLDLSLKGLNNPYRPFAFALNGAKLVGRKLSRCVGPA